MKTKNLPFCQVENDLKKLRLSTEPGKRIFVSELMHEKFRQNPS